MKKTFVSLLFITICVIATHSTAYSLNFQKIHTDMYKANIKESLPSEDSENLEKPIILEVKHENNLISLTTNYIINSNDYSFKIYQDNQLVEELSIINQRGEVIDLHIYQHLNNNEAYLLQIVNQNYIVNKEFITEVNKNNWQMSWDFISSNMVEIKFNEDIQKIGILYPNNFKGYIQYHQGNKIHIYSEENFKRDEIYDFIIKYSDNNYNEINDIYGYFRYSENNNKELSINRHQYINPYELEFHFNYHLEDNFLNVEDLTFNNESITFINSYIKNHNTLVIKTDKIIKNGNYSIKIANLKNSFYQTYNDVEYKFTIDEIEEHPIFYELDEIEFINNQVIRFKYPKDIEIKDIESKSNYLIRDIYSNKQYSIENIEINEENYEVELKVQINDMNRHILLSVNYLLPDKQWLGYEINNGGKANQNYIKDVNLVFLDDGELGKGYYIKLDGVFTSNLRNIVFIQNNEEVKLDSYHKEHYIYYKINNIEDDISIKLNDEANKFNGFIIMPKDEELNIKAYYIDNVIKLKFNDSDVQFKDTDIVIKDKDNETIDFSITKNDYDSSAFYILLEEGFEVSNIKEIDLKNISSYLYTNQNIVLTNFKIYKNNANLVSNIEIIDEYTLSFDLPLNYEITEKNKVGFIDEDNHHLLSIQYIENNNGNIIVKTSDKLSNKTSVILFKDSILHKYLPYSFNEDIFFTIEKLDTNNDITPYISHQRYSLDKNQILYNNNFIMGKSKSVEAENYLILTVNNYIIGETYSNSDGSFEPILIPIDYRHYKNFKLYSVKDNGVANYIEIIKQ